MEHTAHDSKAMKSTGYENGNMEVTYHSGKTYVHPGVSPELYNEFMAAPSKGIFLNQRVKAEHPGTLKP